MTLSLRRDLSAQTTAHRARRFFWRLPDALAHQKTRMQIWLVWTDLEEAINSFGGNDGLYGSRHLAQKLAGNGMVSRIRGLFLSRHDWR